MKPAARDTWFLAALLRFVLGMLVWAAFLFLSPLLLVISLVFGVHRMSADEIALMKVLLVIVGPFAFVFWWIIVSHSSERYQAKRLIASRSETGDNYTEAELKFLEQVGKPHHFRTMGMLVVSFIGSLCGAYLSSNAGVPAFLFWVLLAIFSPAIMVGAWRLLRNSN